MSARKARRSTGRQSMTLANGRGDPRAHRREGQRLTERDIDEGSLEVKEGKMKVKTCPPLIADDRRGIEIKVGEGLTVGKDGSLMLSALDKDAINITQAAGTSAATNAATINEILDHLISMGFLK